MEHLLTRSDDYYLYANVVHSPVTTLLFLLNVSIIIDLYALNSNQNKL